MIPYGDCFNAYYFILCLVDIITRLDTNRRQHHAYYSGLLTSAVAAPKTARAPTWNNVVSAVATPLGL